MNGMALLLVLTTPGIEYGWQPGQDGRLEYIIQLEPEALEALRGGKPISSDIHPDARGVRRFVLRVGEDPVPRVAIPDEALEETPAAGNAPHTPSAPTAASGNARATPNNTGRSTNARQPSRYNQRTGASTGRTPSAPIQRTTTGQQTAPQRGAPPLLSSDEQAADATQDNSGGQSYADDGSQFQLTDDTTEDGGGAYGTVPTPDRRTSTPPNQQPQNASPWSRWNPPQGSESEQTVVDSGGGDQNRPQPNRFGQNHWQPLEQQEEDASSNAPEVDPRDLPPDPDALWAQEQERPQRLGNPADEDEEYQRWLRSRGRNTAGSADFAGGTERDREEILATGYSAGVSNDYQNTTANTPAVDRNSPVLNNTSAVPGSATTPVQATAETPPAAAPATSNDLFKELLLFASLGVNVVAVVIARQYYLRYCMLVHEVRESESLAA